MGPALCLLSAACFGAMPIFGKLAYEAGMSPGTLLAARFLLAAGLLLTLVLLRPQVRTPALEAGSSPRPAAGRRRAVLTALGLGAVGYAMMSTLYFSALTRLDAPLVALVLYTYPVLVALAAVALGRDRLTPRRVVALAVSSCGTLLVLLGAGGGVSIDVLGVALAFGAAITYTTYILVADRSVHLLSPVVLTVWVMTGAAAALTALVVATGEVTLDVDPVAWLWVGCLAVVSTVVAMLAFFAGLRRTGPSTAAILSTVEPVVTTALAALVLREFLAPVQLVGVVVVLAAIVVLQLGPRPAPTRAAVDEPPPTAQRAAA